MTDGDFQVKVVLVGAIGYRLAIEFDSALAQLSPGAVLAVALGLVRNLGQGGGQVAAEEFLEVVGVSLGKGVACLVEDDSVGFIAAFGKDEFDCGSVEAPGF